MRTGGLMFAVVLGCSGSLASSDGGLPDGSAPIAKVAIASAISGTTTQCRLSTVSSIMDPPGQGVLGIGNTNTLTIANGQSWLGGTVLFACTIAPNGSGGFTVSGRAELMGVSQGATGTFMMSGTFAPKDASGAAPDVQNVQGRLTTTSGSLTSATCVGTFDGMDQSGNRCTVGMTDANGNIICTKSTTMDLKPPTSSSGAIWGTVFCANASDANQNPPRTCNTAVTFRFENCAMN